MVILSLLQTTVGTTFHYFRKVSCFSKMVNFLQQAASIDTGMRVPTLRPSILWCRNALEMLKTSSRLGIGTALVK